MKSQKLGSALLVVAAAAATWDASATTIRWRSWLNTWNDKPGVRFMNSDAACTQESLEKTRWVSELQAVSVPQEASTAVRRAPVVSLSPEVKLIQDLKNFVGSDNVVISLRDIEKMNLKKMRTTNDVWSDSYWPDQQGGIASPHAQLGFPDSRLDFRTNYSWFKRNREKKVWPRANDLSPKEIDRLSPAEKYDLLVGDTQFTLTKSVWEDIWLRHANDMCQMKEQSHFVEIRFPRAIRSLFSWAGICNGWALASLSFKRPESKVTAISPTGQVIPFYPSDLRALASHLGARSSVNTEAGAIHFLGNRCYEKGRVKRDIYGQIKDSACADIDAAAWHLAVINKLGIQKQGFVLERKLQEAISNHPVYAYEMTYFNPESGDNGTLTRSLVPAGSFNDMYEAKRHKETKFIVGVEMKVSMLGNINRRHKNTFDRGQDKRLKQKYIYDLELDEDMNVLGGKWRLAKSDRKTLNLGIRVAKRPDFIWTLANGYELIGLNDPIPKFDPPADLVWDGRGAVPPKLREIAQKSSYYSMPLNAVIRVLLEKSDLGPKQSTGK